MDSGRAASEPSFPQFPRLSPSHPVSYPYFAQHDEFELDPSLPYGQAMIAGASAGVMEHLFMFPIDTIKTRMQALSLSASDRPYTSLRDAITRIAREEGILRLYRGVTAVVIGAIPSHAANYATYEYFKNRLGGNAPGHHPFAHAASGAMATLAHDAVITPLDVVKQRLQMRGSPYRGVLDCVKQVMRQEGLLAFYASYPTTVLLNVPFMAVHFSAYEAFKLVLTGVDKANEHGILQEVTAGGLAGACAGLISTPFDVVKTRQQTQVVVEGQKRMGGIEVAKRIWREEGLRGFLRGATARVLYFIPSAAICWGTYETVKKLLKDAS